MTKKILFLLAIIFLAGLALYLLPVSSYVRIAVCSVRGGKMVVNYKWTCEIKAKDGGKKCTYDNECSKGFCFYPASISREYPADVAARGGACAAYEGDYVSGQCHRRSGESSLEQLLYGAEGQVTCEQWVR